ncbi:MAG: site-specific integrase [Alphaproteobacteria bacterium]|nr:site-specific integrase [Alphaproteobacteria bacterium]
MSRSERITNKLVAGLIPPAKGNYITYDATGAGGQDPVRGFGVRITANKVKAFVLAYRHNGISRIITLGRAGVWSAEAARKRAKELRKAIDTGTDPLADKEADRTAPTVRQLTDDYIRDHLPTKRVSSQEGDKKMIARFILPKLRNHKVADVTLGQLRALHRDMASTPYQANRVAALLSTMFGLAIELQYRTDNPAKGIKRYPEPPRTKYLTPDEIGRLTAALDAATDQRSANVVRLTLLTGCRVGEALSARWENLDLDEGRWVKPAHTTKQKATHETPLSDAAVTLLRSILSDAPAAGGGPLVGPYVFPGRVHGTHHDNIKRFWWGIRTDADLDWLRIHDLRHTFASVLASAGASLPMIGALLGHTQPATTARYAHLYDDPLRRLTNQVGHVVNGTTPAEVVPLRKDGAA